MEPYKETLKYGKNAYHIKGPSALKFARLHSHAVLRPAVRVHHELVVVGAVGERAQERLLIGRLRAERGLVVLVGVLHDLGDTGAACEVGFYGRVFDKGAVRAPPIQPYLDGQFEGDLSDGAEGGIQPPLIQVLLCHQLSKSLLPRMRVGGAGGFKQEPMGRQSNHSLSKSSNSFQRG